jgi:exonuclease III
MKLTVKQMRHIEAVKLACFKNPCPLPSDIAEATKWMNSFYRLCGLAERNLYADNDERTCNTRWHKEDEEREYRWWQRLDKTFQELYGLRLVYCGYMPSIGEITTPGGGFSEKIARHFYN